MLRLDESLNRRADRGAPIGPGALIERVDAELSRMPDHRSSPAWAGRRGVPLFQRPGVVVAAVIMMALILAVPLLFLGGTDVEPIDQPTLSSVPDSVDLTPATSVPDAAPGTSVPARPVIDLPGNWTRLAGSPEFDVQSGGSAEMGIHHMVARPERIVAIGVTNLGCTFPPAECDEHVTIWTSRDGLSWEQRPWDTSFDDGSVAGVTSDGTSMIAVGEVRRFDEQVYWTQADGGGWDWTPTDPAVWLSADVTGTEWTRIILDAGVVDSRLVGATGGPVGYVALGSVDLYALDSSSRTQTCDGEQFGLDVDVRCPATPVTWTSSDGTTWTQHSLSVDGTLETITSLPGAYLAAGTGPPNNCVPAETGVLPPWEICNQAPQVWRSEDGITWNPMAIEARVADGFDYEQVWIRDLDVSGQNVVASAWFEAQRFSADGTVGETAMGTVFFHSPDGGKSWTRVPLGQVFPDSGAGSDLNVVVASEAGFAAASSDTPSVLSTSSDGLKWTLVSDPPHGAGDWLGGGGGVGSSMFFVGTTSGGGLIVAGLGD